MTQTTSRGLLYALKHLVYDLKVLHNWVSEIITAITYLSKSLYILSALSTLFGRYVRYIRLRYYFLVKGTI